MAARFVEIGAIAGLLLGSACGGGHEAAAPVSRDPVPVTVGTVRLMDIREPLEIGGTVTARHTADVSSRVMATILDVHVRAGDRVRAGQRLITLDARDVAAQARQARASLSAAEQGLPQARADLAAARAELELATAWHRRIAALQERNSATPQELDEATARLSAATARVQAAEAGIARADASLDAVRAGSEAASTTESFTIISAPFAGVVAERLVDGGSLAVPGTPLLRLDADGPRRVEVRVDEARLRYVRRGDRAAVVVGSDEGEDREYEGVVEEIARPGAAAGRTFVVTLTLPAARDLRSGAFARVRFGGAPRQALIAPADAVRRQGQVASAFVVQDDVARLRLLQVGADVPDGVEILAGLADGDRVVRTPPPALADGSPVRTTAGSGGTP